MYIAKHFACYSDQPLYIAVNITYLVGVRNDAIERQLLSIVFAAVLAIKKCFLLDELRRQRLFTDNTEVISTISLNIRAEINNCIASHFADEPASHCYVYRKFVSVRPFTVKALLISQQIFHRCCIKLTDNLLVITPYSAVEPVFSSHANVPCFVVVVFIPRTK